MSRRQIVFLMTDTQRWDMLGCYGHPAMKTPHLDRLASQGMRFDRAYTCQPVCGPARAALFTGTWPHNNGSWSNGLALGAYTRHLGQLLAPAGIHAAYIGKWHLDAFDYFGRGEAPEGWDPGYWYDMRMYLEELSPEDRRRSRETATNRDPRLTAEFTFAHRCSDRAMGFLADHADEDFCLVVSYDEPHHPHLCPEPYASMYRDYQWPKPPNVRDPLTNKPEHQRVWSSHFSPRDPDKLVLRPADFLGCNSFVDLEIGRVLAAIDRYTPGALVIYTSDHGEAMASHGIWGKGPVVYDEVTRIPMIVRWPGQTPAGTVCAHLASHIDVVPTLLEAMNLKIPRFLEGVSMLATLRDPTRRSRDAVFMEFGRYEVSADAFGGFQPTRAIFDGRYKLAIHLLSGDEMYDIEADPWEMNNLIDSPAHVTIRNRLHDRLLAWMNESVDPFRGYYWERRPWRVDAAPASWAYTGMCRQPEPDADEKRELSYDTGLEYDVGTRRR